MGRIGTAAGLILPIALATGTVSLLAAAGVRGSTSVRVELELAALVPLPEGPGRLLVLKEKNQGGRVLAFVVQDAQPAAPPRVPTGPRASGGLLGRTLSALGARVREVEIDRAEETSGASRVVLERSGQRYTVSALPSESVALAVDAGAPILATRALLDAEGLTAADLARVREQAEAKPPVSL
ncbi:MAG: DUF151 domain-containing protein [Anaeromyxobacteraceae bacterium]